MKLRRRATTQRLGMTLVGLTLVGCTTWRVQKVPVSALVAESKPGKIRIATSNVGTVVLNSPTVVGDSIRGSQRTVAVADVTSIAVRKFDILKTLGLAGGVFAVAGIACAMSDCTNYEIPNVLVRLKVP